MKSSRTYILDILYYFEIFIFWDYSSSINFYWFFLNEDSVSNITKFIAGQFVNINDTPSFSFY